MQRPPAHFRWHRTIAGYREGYPEGPSAHPGNVISSVPTESSDDGASLTALPVGARRLLPPGQSSASGLTDAELMPPPSGPPRPIPDRPDHRDASGRIPLMGWPDVLPAKP